MLYVLVYSTSSTIYLIYCSTFWSYVHYSTVRNTETFIGVISADDLPSVFDDEQQSTFIERLGAGTDKLLAEFFCWWGTGMKMLPRIILHNTAILPYLTFPIFFSVRFTAVVCFIRWFLIYRCIGTRNKIYTRYHGPGWIMGCSSISISSWKRIFRQTFWTIL